MLSITIAALGDSLTDEYQFYAPYRTAAQNWPEILSNLRPTQVDLGAFTTSSRGETRNQGYAQDWARQGATAQGTDLANGNTTFVEQYEGGFAPGLPGLLTQPGGISNINVVNILIGGNDYFRAIINTVADPSSIFTNLEDASTGILSAIETVVPLIESANPNTKIILNTVPNVTDIALYQSLTSILPSDAVALVTGLITSSVNALNTQIAQYAQSQGTGFVDDNALFENLIKTPYFDGVYINPTAAGPSFTDMFVGDGIHPGTIAQSILANAMIAQIDNFFPGAVTPLSNSEILQLAESTQPKTQVALAASTTGVTPGQPVTLAATIPSFPPNLETSADPPAPNNLEAYPVPTGLVTFYDASNHNQVLAIAQLNPSGVATCTTSGLTPGMHLITASYSGDKVYPATVSSAITIAVGTKAQVRLLNTVQAFESQLNLQFAPTLVNKWMNSLKRGAPSRQVSRQVIRYVYFHTHWLSGSTASVQRAHLGRQAKDER